MPEQADVEQQAVDAASAVLGPAVERELVARALKAAGDVYEADREAWAEQQLTETRLDELTINSDGLKARLKLADETAAHLVMVARTYLDATGAENYVEQEVVDRDSYERYTFTIRRPRGLSPHELRVEAECRAENLEAQRDQVLAYLDGRPGVIRDRVREIYGLEAEDAEEV